MTRLDTPSTASSAAPSRSAPRPPDASDLAALLPIGKIKDWHLQRKAVVYIRQSTPQQVIDHRESTDRQYALAHRAALLGWPKDRIEVVDEDQGQSGQSAVGRLG